MFHNKCFPSQSIICPPSSVYFCFYLSGINVLLYCLFHDGRVVPLYSGYGRRLTIERFRHRIQDGCNNIAPRITRLNLNRLQSILVGRKKLFHTFMSHINHFYIGPLNHKDALSLNVSPKQKVQSTHFAQMSLQRKYQSRLLVQ